MRRYHMKSRLIFRLIAENNHTSAEEVRKEIAAAIRAGMENPDPKVQQRWEALRERYGEISPEVFLCELAERMKANGNRVRSEY